MKFDFSEEKNKRIFENRGVSFYQAIETIAEKGVLLNIEHPNQDKYPDQHILVIEMEGYTYCIPYIIDGNTWYLKTIYPSRKFHHLIDLERENEEEI
jgi:uncharacterized DUF497 family protein